MASAILQEISRDENERALFRSRKKAEMDNYSNIKTAKCKGEMRSDRKWKKVITKKEAEIAKKNAEITKLLNE